MTRMLIAVALLAIASPAAAQPADQGAEPADRPWAAGVPEADQERALELFGQGNELFERRDYAGAVKLYREALESWDHPAIRGNLATALIYLEKPVEAHAHLEAALRWGEAPFEAHVYNQLVTNRKLLLGQLAQIAVTCDADGAEVTLNGIDFLTCPGEQLRYAVAGSHQLVARKPSYLTFAQKINALPGQVTRIEVNLVPLAEAGGYERRWSVWKPWAVVGAGAGVTLLGVALQLAASSNIDEYDNEIAQFCPNGCTPDSLPQAVRDLESRGVLQGRLAVTSFVLGGVGLAAGAALVYLNQPQRIRLDADGNRISVAPAIGPGLAGVNVRLDF